MWRIFVGILWALMGATAPAALGESVFTTDQPGFGSQRPIVNVVNQTFNPKSTATPEQIVQAFTRAGTRRGWIVTATRPGELVARLHTRQHVAVVDITYTATSFSITYKSSEKLQYNAERNVIHKSYNVWVQNLRNDILSEISML